MPNRAVGTLLFTKLKTLNCFTEKQHCSRVFLFSEFASAIFPVFPWIVNILVFHAKFTLRKITNNLYCIIM